MKKKAKKVKYINHTALCCKKCGAIIISWYRHDFRSCNCTSEGFSIDGGFDYIKVSGNGENYELYNIKVPETMRR